RRADTLTIACARSWSTSLRSFLLSDFACRRPPNQLRASSNGLATRSAATSNGLRTLAPVDCTPCRRPPSDSRKETVTRASERTLRIPTTSRRRTTALARAEGVDVERWADDPIAATRADDLPRGHGGLRVGGVAAGFSGRRYR